MIYLLAFLPLLFVFIVAILHYFGFLYPLLDYFGYYDKDGK